MPRETKVERLRIPDLRAPSSSTDAFYLGRLPTFLAVEEMPFDKKTFIPVEKADKLDKFLMQTENTIRWRVNDRVIIHEPGG